MAAPEEPAACGEHLMPADQREEAGGRRFQPGLGGTSKKKGPLLTTLPSHGRNRVKLGWGPHTKKTK